MVSKMRNVLTAALLLLLFTGCSSQSDTMAWLQYQQWLFGEDNTLKKVKQVNNINLTTQFLPANYLAYKEMLADEVYMDSTHYKSAMSHYQCGLTFRILVEPEKGGVNLLYHRVSSEVGFKQRVNALSFETDKYISMKVGEQEYPPVLAQYEGYNEMLNRLVFTTVFQPQEFNCGTFSPDTEKITITFDDPFWSTGVNNFTYGTASLTDVPKIILN